MWLVFYIHQAKLVGSCIFLIFLAIYFESQIFSLQFQQCQQLVSIYNWLAFHNDVQFQDTCWLFLQRCEQHSGLLRRVHGSIQRMMSELISMFRKIAFEKIHGMIYIDDLIISIRWSQRSSFGWSHGHVLAIRYACQKLVLSKWLRPSFWVGILYQHLSVVTCISRLIIWNLWSFYVDRIGRI